MSERNTGKAVGLASLGTIIEWAEYIFYGYMALTLAKWFFPQDNPTIDLLKTYGVFAAGFLARPFGALLFGYLGDAYGRRYALMISMLLMGFATMAIGLLPGYQSIGILAPLLLLVLRIVQGLAVSGEYNGAAIFSIEHNPDQPCFKGSFIPASAAFGMSIGGLAAFVVSLSAMPSWAWRVPFLLGGLGCLLALYLRVGLNDSEEFINAKQKAVPLPLWSLIKTYKSSFLRVGAIAAMTSVYVYIGNVFYVVFLTKTVGFSLTQATFIALLAQLFVAIGILLTGWLGDKINPIRLYQIGLIFTMVSFPFIFVLSASGQLLLLSFGITLYVIGNAWLSGPMMLIVQRAFPTLVRYRGSALAWGIAASIFGGTSLMVASMMQDTFNSIYAPGFYVSIFAVITLVIIRITGAKQPTLDRVQFATT